MAKKRSNYAEDRWDPGDRAEVLHVVRTTVARYPKEPNRFCAEKVSGYVKQAAVEGVDWADRSMLPLLIVGSSSIVRKVRDEMARRTIKLNGRPISIKQILYFRDPETGKRVPVNWWEANLAQWRDAVALDDEMEAKPKPQRLVRQLMLDIFEEVPLAPDMRTAALEFGLDPDNLELRTDRSA